MNYCRELPEGYSEIFTVNLQKDRKMALKLNVAALIVAVIMAVPMHFYIPFGSLFDFSQGFGMYCLRFGVLIAGYFAYIVLHELTHGVTMKIFGCDKVKYGFTGLYAFAGCDVYFGKKSYIAVALSPVVVWGIVLAVINVFVPESWFWVVYFIQIGNISGAAGDFYVTCKFSRMPKDILVKDIGVGMTVYSAQNR